LERVSCHAHGASRGDGGGGVYVVNADAARVEDGGGVDAVDADDVDAEYPSAFRLGGEDEDGGVDVYPPSQCFSVSILSSASGHGSVEAESLGIAWWNVRCALFLQPKKNARNVLRGGGEDACGACVCALG
jgi:hypothetical protein